MKNLRWDPGQDILIWSKDNNTLKACQNYQQKNYCS